MSEEEKRGGEALPPSPRFDPRLYFKPGTHASLSIVVDPSLIRRRKCAEAFHVAVWIRNKGSDE